MASWKNLAELFLKQGKSEQYGLVLKELERLNSLPAEIRSVASFLYEGQLSQTPPKIRRSYAPIGVDWRQAARFGRC